MSRDPAPMPNLPVTMIRADLDHIPQFTLPDPFTLRWYRPGDEAHWLRIHELADRFSQLSAALFPREFGLDPAILAPRQCYLCDAAGEAIGTATAWFDDDYHGQSFGRIHWVAIVPVMQGRGLAKPLMTAVMNRLRELGHTRAYLRTSTARPVAIRLYQRFGFTPEIHTPQDRAAWAPYLP